MTTPATAPSRRDVTRFRTHQEITDYVRSAYAMQRFPVGGRTPRLSPLVAEPNSLIVQAVLLAGDDGITDADLRRVVPVAAKRYERAVWRLHRSGTITRTKERRCDGGGRERDQVVWRKPTTTHDVARRRQPT